MENNNLLQEYFNSQIDIDEMLTPAVREKLENDFEVWFEKKISDFEFVSRFLIKYMAENWHPHAICLVDSLRSEVYSSEKVYGTEEFLVD